MSTQEPEPQSGASIWPWICLAGVMLGVFLSLQGARMAQQAKQDSLRIQQQQQQQQRFR